MQGEIHLGRLAGIHPEELGRRHTDHGERHVVDQNRLTGRLCGAAKTPLAVAHADHRHRWRAGAIVVAKDQTARCWQHREPAKEVARDVFAPGELGLAFNHDVDFASRDVGKDAGKDWRRRLLQTLECWERENRCRDAFGVAIGTAVGAAHHELARFGVGVRFTTPFHHHQRRGVRHGQRAQQDGVHEAVDRRVRTDSKRERQCGQGGEHPVLEHRPQAVADVLTELLERDPRPERASVFLHERWVAQVESGRQSGLVRRQPDGLPCIRLFAQMELQLFVELVFHAPPLQPPRELPKQRGHRPSSPSGFSSKPMARANASHLDCSLINCFPPKGVIR